MSITITFHKYHHSPWDDRVEMSNEGEVNDKDELKLVVMQRLVTPSSSNTMEQCPVVECEFIGETPILETASATSTW